MVRLLLIRHCQSSGQGVDALLTGGGRRAAEDLASILVALGVDAVYSSPYQRARQTVAPFAAQAGLDVAPDVRLREQTLADPPVTNWLDNVRLSFANPEHRAPGGESVREVRERGLAALTDIAGVGHSLAAVATHGRWLAAIIETVDATFGYNDWRALTNPDLFDAVFESGRLVSVMRSPAAVSLFGGGNS